jgi:translation initiation factor 3 subunit C
MMSDDDGPASKPAAPAKPAMSRFLRTTGSASSSSSEDSEDSEDSDEDGVEKEAPKKSGSRFLKGDSDDEESDEDVKRVVKSARDKRLEEMEATGKAMANALKINDWTAMQNGWSGLPSPPDGLLS